MFLRLLGVIALLVAAHGGPIAPGAACAFYFELPSRFEPGTSRFEDGGLGQLPSLAGQNGVLPDAVAEQALTAMYGSPCGAGRPGLGGRKGALSPQRNTVAMLGVDPRVCELDHWKITTVISVPCASLEASAPCWYVRLVAQPVMPHPYGLEFPDQALHLRYVLRNAPDLTAVRDLPTTQYAGRAGLYRLAIRSDAAPQDHLYTRLVRDLIVSGELDQVSWITATPNSSQWTFGRLQRSRDGFKPDSLGFENLDRERFLNSECSLGSTRASSEARVLFDCGAPFSAARKQDILEEQVSVQANPASVGSCAVCHAANDLKDRNTHKMAFDERGVSYAGRRADRVLIMRQFGYDYHGDLRISARTLDLIGAPAPHGSNAEP